MLRLMKNLWFKTDGRKNCGYCICPQFVFTIINTIILQLSSVIQDRYGAVPSLTKVHFL